MDKLRKLHRSRNHRLIAGVMGGIAEYLGWSPFWTRLLFIALSSFGAIGSAVPGILVYLVLWVVMPNATQASYKSASEY